MAQLRASRQPSASKQLLNSPELQELLLDNFNPSGVIVLDHTRTVVYASPKALQALELTPEELVGKNFTDAVPFLDAQGNVIPEDKRPSYRALSGTSVQATLFFCQYRVPATGELFSLAIRSAAIRRKKQVLGAIVEIRRAVRQLDVGGMKALFTAFAAHQLKTPSSIVKGFLELMIRQGKNTYKPEQWNYLNSAFDANERLIRLSQTLLNITRLEGGMIELQIAKTNIVRVLQDKIQNYKKSTAATGVSFQLSAGEDVSQVLTDGAFVGEIVDVLLSNALKVAPVGSKVVIATHREHKRLEISVTDAGPGLPEEILALLRGPLAQHQPQGGAAGGNGLGLYMARKYAALLNGDIVAENTAEGGARVTLVLPRVEDAQQ